MIPEGYHSVTPWMIGSDTAGLIDFLVAAFGAEELGRMAEENGVVTEPTHLFWGDAVGGLADPYGNLYWVQTRMETVSDEEIARRMSDPEFAAALEYVQSSLFVPETR